MRKSITVYNNLSESYNKHVNLYFDEYMSVSFSKTKTVGSKYDRKNFIS